MSSAATRLLELLLPLGLAPSGLAPMTRAATNPWDTGIVTLMLRGHPSSGGKVACARHPLVARAIARDGRLRDEHALVALRNRRHYPCGSRVEIVLPRTRKSLRDALVVDAGPAGVRCGTTRRLATRQELTTEDLPPGCVFSAAMDLTRGGHVLLGGDGYEWMRFRPQR